MILIRFKMLVIRIISIILLASMLTGCFSSKIIPESWNVKEDAFNHTIDGIYKNEDINNTHEYINNSIERFISDNNNTNDFKALDIKNRYRADLSIMLTRNIDNRPNINKIVSYVKLKLIKNKLNIELFDKDYNSRVW